MPSPAARTGHREVRQARHPSDRLGLGLGLVATLAVALQHCSWCVAWGTLGQGHSDWSMEGTVGLLHIRPEGCSLKSWKDGGQSLRRRL